MIAVEVPQDEEITGGGKNERRKGVGSAIHRRAKRGSTNIGKRERGVVKRDADPYIIRVGVKRREREREKVERLKKDKPCLTKMMTLPLTCVVSGVRMPD